MNIQKGLKPAQSHHNSSRRPLSSKRPHVVLDKKRLMLFAGICLFLILFGFLVKTKSLYSKIYTGKNTGSSVKKDQKIFSILLMGYGGGRHEGTYLTDTMIVARIDIEKKKATLVSIPRDLWVKVPISIDSTAHSKINSIYQMGLFPDRYPAIPEKYQGDQGAADMIKSVVGVVTGIPIDYYMTVDFEGFTKAIDVLGGVDVTVQKAFDDYEYPIEGKEDDPCGKEGTAFDEAVLQATESAPLAFPCRFEHLHFDTGRQHMDGTTALKFVRSRHALADGGDFARANRQQLFIDAVKEKILTVAFLPKIIPIMNELSNHIRTDIPSELMQMFVQEAGSHAQDYTRESIILTTDNVLESGYSNDRQYILQPKTGIDNWESVRDYINNTIIGITPTPDITSLPTKKR